ncbi:SDR family oxidoreductase [Bacillus sp. N9]
MPDLLLGVNVLTIFLTGSAGFLGGKLMWNLLSDTDHDLYMLVRDLERAQNVTENFPIEFQNRIHLLQGDITQPSCGLAESQIQSLQNKIHVFYHLAALVKFDLELRDEIFSVNYEGTKNALELGKAILAEKFFYISTAYTVGKKAEGKEQLYSIDDEYNNPYEESKAKSEHLAFSYANEMDVSIFRPSIIVGDSKTGEADSKFTLYGFMRALEIFKRRVLRNKENERKTYRVIAHEDGTSNFVPVNYVADILSLAATKAEPNKIYHITNPNPATNLQIFMMLKNALEFSQLRIKGPGNIADLNEDEQKLNEMIQVFNPYLTSAIAFEDENTRVLIKNSDIHHLHLTPETMQMIINAYFDL